MASQSAASAQIQAAAALGKQSLDCDHRHFSKEFPLGFATGPLHSLTVVISLCVNYQLANQQHGGKSGVLTGRQYRRTFFFIGQIKR